MSIERGVERPERRSSRLAGYDYATPGAYFVTICTQNRECLFGEIVDGVMVENSVGRIVDEEWLRTAEIRSEVELDAFVVMPNHLHGLVVFLDGARGSEAGAHGRAPLRRTPRSLGSLVAGFKSAATKRVNELRESPGARLWQRNYHEHVVRNEGDLNRIREYVAVNPALWAEDENNPARVGAHGRAPTVPRERVTSTEIQQ